MLDLHIPVCSAPPNIKKTIICLVDLKGRVLVWNLDSYWIHVFFVNAYAGTFFEVFILFSSVFESMLPGSAQCQYLLSRTCNYEPKTQDAKKALALNSCTLQL